MSSTPPQHSLSSSTSANDALSSSPVLPTPSSSSSASEVTRQLRRELEQQISEKEKQLQDSTSGIGRSVLARQISQLKERLQEMDRRQQAASSSPSNNHSPTMVASSSSSIQRQPGSPLRRAQSPSSVSGDEDLPPTALEKLQKLERDIGAYRALSPNLSSSLRKDKLRTGLDPLPSPSTSTMLPPAHGHDSTSLLPLPPPPTGSTPTKRRSKVPNTDRRNTDIEFATEIGQGLLMEVRKMQSLLQEKDDQLKALQAAKADLERAAESMAKQLRQREENEEKLKEETWNLELAKQELTFSVSELQQNLNRANAEQKRMQEHMDELTSEIEQLRDSEEKLRSTLDTMKQRHEQDMGTLRRHSAGLQREKADFMKQVEALSSELAIAKAQSRIAKRSHSDLNKASNAVGMATNANQAQNEDTLDVSKDNATSSSDNGSQSPKSAGGAPRNQALEVETLKTSLAHAHRMVSNLRSSLHKEKTEKFEFKKLLSESQETIEQLQNDPRLWVDAGYPKSGSGASGGPDSNGSNARRTRKGKRRVPVSKTRVARPTRGDGDSDIDERRKRKDSQLHSSYSLTSGESEEDDDDYYDEEDLTGAAVAGAVAGAGLASLGSELSKSQQRDEHVTRSLGDELSAAFDSAPAPSTSSDAFMQTDDAPAKEPVQLQQMSLESFGASPVIAQEKHVQCEPPKVVDAETQSQKPEYVDSSAQHEANPMVDSAAQCDVAVTQDQGVQSEAPESHDVFVQSEAPESHDVFVQSEAPESHDVFVQSDIPEAHDVSVQSDVPEAHDVSVQSDVPEAHDMSVQYEAIPGVDMSTQMEIPEYKDISIQSDPADVKDGFTQFDAPEIIDMGVQSEATEMIDSSVQAEPADVKDSSTQMDIVEAKDMHVQHEPVFESKEAFVQCDPANVKDSSVQHESIVETNDMSVQHEPIVEYKDSSMQSDAASMKDSSVQSEETITKDTGVQYESADNTSDASVQVDLLTASSASVPSTTATEVGGAFGLGALAAAAFGKLGGSKVMDTANIGTADREIKPSSQAREMKSPSQKSTANETSEQLNNAPADKSVSDNAIDEQLKNTSADQVIANQLNNAPVVKQSLAVPEQANNNAASVDAQADSQMKDVDNSKPLEDDAHAKHDGATPINSMQDEPSTQAKDEQDDVVSSQQQPLTDSATDLPSQNDDQDAKVYSKAETDALIAAAVSEAMAKAQQQHSNGTVPGSREIRNKPSLADLANGVIIQQQQENDIPPRPVSPPPAHLLSRVAQSPTPSLSTSSANDKGKAPARSIGSIGSASQQLHQQRPPSLVSSVSTSEPRASIGSSAYDTTSLRAYADPQQVGLITQTMIGDWMWKYTRKSVGAGLSENRHKRFFWIHPYTRTLYWSTKAPGTHGNEIKAKSALIEGVTAEPDYTQPPSPGVPNVSLLVKTTNRVIKLTAPTMARHQVWLESLSYLLSRPSNGDASSSLLDSIDRRTNGTASVSSHRIIRKPSVQNMFRSVTATQHRDLDDDDDDFEDEAIEDVRMCCDGKHHVSKLQRDHIHHRPYYRKRQSRQAQRASNNNTIRTSNSTPIHQQRAAAY